MGRAEYLKKMWDNLTNHERCLDEIAKKIIHSGGCERDYPCKNCSMNAQHRKDNYLYCGCYAKAEELYIAGLRKVVLCKDCKWYSEIGHGCCHERHDHLLANALSFEPDDFCSYGERKEN